MGLRDAIDAGREEIRTTAEEIISHHGIEELIKRAVVRSETRVSVSFDSKTRRISNGNLYVIQQEVVRQITEEGFKVEWEKPCCPDAVIRNRGGRGYVDKPDDYYCETCKADDLVAGVRYGRITINWDQSN